MTPGTGACRIRHAQLLAVAEILCRSLSGASSHRLAALVEGGALGGRATRTALEGCDWLEDGLGRTRPERIEHWARVLGRLAERGIQMVDAADSAYPANLRMIHDRPPFLMVRGELTAADDRAVAVVGTRRPSPGSTRAAAAIARQLAARGVTVVSGLAEGIDTAAHAGALSTGGRTIAVLGTGIELDYPARNRSLAAAIARSGACVSQFWPSMQGARWTFPARNIVTSGLSLGTLVVEADETSGARLQAEAARRHGKRVLLLEGLVRSQRWARELAARHEAVVVGTADQIARAVEPDLGTDATVLA